MLINWTVAKALPVKSFPSSAVLLGSIAPDIPLYFLSIGGAAWFSWVEKMKPREVAKHMFSDLFYNDPVWISLHNVLHSPTVLSHGVGRPIFRFVDERTCAQILVDLVLSVLVMLHTLVDIPVHHDDGPLIFWPLNWSYRFASPLSYWDRNHYASIVIPFEITLAIVLASNLIWKRFKARPERSATSPVD